jgi:16S rRNA (guanine527-N7)-methyltransferase
VDIGTGGGFPGLVLAAAVPGLAVTLVEPRQRKGAFLRTVLRKTSLPCTWLDGRVSLPLPKELPPGIDALTLRALKLPTEVLAALSGRCSGQAQALFWLGLEEPEPPPGWRRGREVLLPGSRHRRIVEMIVNPEEPVGTYR